MKNNIVEKRLEAFSVNSGTFIDKLLHWWRVSVAKSYIKPGNMVCDLGCGIDGYFLKKITPYIKQGWGFDLQVKEKHPNPKIHLQETDLNKPLPLPDNSVEVVTSLAVIEHLEDESNHVKEAFRILKPGGLFIITTPAPKADAILRFLAWLKLVNSEEIKDHKKYFRAKNLEEFLRQNGFKKVKYRKFQLGYNQIVIGEK